MSLWLLLVFVGPVCVWLLYQLITREHCRCEVCNKRSSFIGTDGQCASCAMFESAYEALKR